MSDLLEKVLLASIKKKDKRIAELEDILIDTHNSFTIDLLRIQEAIPELKEHK